MRKRVEDRSRQANWKRRERAQGDCPQCGERCDINPRTGGPFSRCARCRVAYNEQQKRLMRRRRQKLE